MAMNLGPLCEAMGLECPAGARDVRVNAVRPLLDAGTDDISFLDNPVYRTAASQTRAAAVFVRPEDASLLPETCVPLITAQPYVAFAMSLGVLYPQEPLQANIDPTAVVAPTAYVAATARVDAFAVIGEGAVVSDGAWIGPHAVLGKDVKIGRGTRVGAHVTLMKTAVGERCIIHPGVCVGQDGFGFALHGGKIVKIPQVGGVLIGHDVEIGANTTIDCGALGDTVIGDMVKIDNQVQIGHNVRIGMGSRVVAQVGIAGSATLGAFTVIGGQSGIAGHISIADKVQVAARSGVTKAIHTVGTIVAGFPAVPLAEWKTAVARLARMGRSRQKPKTDGGAA